MGARSRMVAMHVELATRRLELTAPVMASANATVLGGAKQFRIM